MWRPSGCYNIHISTFKFTYLHPPPARVQRMVPFQNRILQPNTLQNRHFTTTKSDPKTRHKKTRKTHSSVVFYAPRVQRMVPFQNRILLPNTLKNRHFTTTKSDPKTRHKKTRKTHSSVVFYAPGVPALLTKALASFWYQTPLSIATLLSPNLTLIGP